MDFLNLIAIKLDELMKEKNITTYQLQDLSGVYSSTIAMFLTRKVKSIRIETLFYLCQALNISISDFFADERFSNINIEK